MNYEQINLLTLEECLGILTLRLGVEEPTQEQLEAEFILYKQELTSIEDARLAEIARLEQLQIDIEALGDIALLIGKYIEGHECSDNDSYNLAGFEVQHFESNFGWNISGKSKPTLAQLQALKPSVDSEQTQQEINQAALAYLAETDWMVVRAAERGEELSLEFKAAREAARNSIIK